jgi:cell division protein ZapA (FtsZ GTPase activity inhibitor)
MAKGHVQIQILGTVFTIQADEDPEYLEILVDYLAKKVREIEQTVSTRDPLRIAILAGLLAADDLHKERVRNADTLPQSEAEEVERITRRLIDRIDESLREE